MASKQRLSMSLMMIIIVMLGVDFAIIKECLFSGPIELALAVLPSSNVLLIMLPKIRERGDNRKFWLVFELVGWLMLLLVVAWFTWVDRPIVLTPITMFYGHRVPETTDSIPSLLIIAFYMSPQLLIAWVSAWLATVEERRLVVWMEQSRRRERNEPERPWNWFYRS